MIRIFIITVLCLIKIQLYAQHPVWTTGNARVVPQSYIELSLTELSKYGLPYNMELMAQVPAIAAVPNLGIKKQWLRKSGDWYFASRHHAYYPGIAFRLLQLTGYRSVLDDTIQMPFILSFTNELMFSKWLIQASSCEAQNYLLTLRAGLKNAMVGSADTVPLFEYPFIFHETQVFQQKNVWYVGIDLDGSLSESMNFCVDIDFYSVNWLVEDFAIQHKGMLYIPLTHRLTGIIGYKAAYSTYPYRDNSLKVYPFIDLILSFRNKKKDDRQLFNKKMRIDYEHF